MDETTLLVENLRDALSQVNHYLGLGLVAAISAFVIDRIPAPATSERESVEVFGGFVKMPRYAAKSVLLGVYFVAGMMAYLAADSAHEILTLLSLPLRNAACTQASVASAQIGYRLIASVLPIAVVLPVIWRDWSRVRMISPGESSGGIVTLIGFSMIPYAALGLELLRVPCGR